MNEEHEPMKPDGLCYALHKWPYPIRWCEDNAVVEQYVRDEKLLGWFVEHEQSWAAVAPPKTSPEQALSLARTIWEQKKGGRFLVVVKFFASCNEKDNGWYAIWSFGALTWARALKLKEVLFRTLPESVQRGQVVESTYGP